MTDISTSMILILDVPFILKWLACMLAVPGFLSVDCYQDGMCRKMGIDHGFHAATKISFGRVSLPQTKEEEIAQAKESPLRSGNPSGLLCVCDSVIPPFTATLWGGTVHNTSR